MHQRSSLLPVSMNTPPAKRQTEEMKLANVAIAMHCNLRPSDAAPVIICLTPMSSLKSLNLSVAVLERFTAVTLRYAVTLTYYPVTLTFDL